MTDDARAVLDDIRARDAAYEPEPSIPGAWKIHGGIPHRPDGKGDVYADREWAWGQAVQDRRDLLLALDAATERVARLLPFIRHRATCALQAVRDNAPDDPACDCGLRETWRVIEGKEPE